MDLKLNSLLNVHNSNEDMIAVTCHKAIDMIELADLMDQCTQVKDTLDRLFSLRNTIKTYGWTQSLETMYGAELRTYSIEATAGGIAKAIGSGIVKFAKMLGSLITKLIKAATSFFSKDRKSQIQDIGDLGSKIGSIQNSTISADVATASTIIARVDAISSHFKVKYKQSMSFGDNEQIENIRNAYRNKFNSLFAADGKVGSDCKLTEPMPTKANQRISALGYTSLEAIKKVDAAIMDAMQAGNNVISEIKHSGEDVAKIVKNLESNQFSNDGGDNAELQGAFVFCRIIYNDLAELRRINGMFGKTVSSMKSIANKYVSGGKSESKAEGEARANAEDN